MSYKKYIKENFNDDSNKERLKYIKGFSEGIAHCNRNWAKRSGFYDIIREHNVKSILDVGCGDGSFCVDMHDVLGAERVYGLDIASVALGLTREHQSVEYFDGEAKNLPLDDGAVEYISAFDVLEHVLPQDVDKVLEEFNRVCTRGMFLTVSHKLSGEIVDGSNMHMCVETPSWWEEKLSKYFKVEFLSQTKSNSGAAAESKILCTKKESS